MIKVQVPAEVIAERAVAKAKEERDEALDSMVHDFGDGRVIQVRPQDAENIDTAISLMTRHSLPTHPWFMQDNKFYHVTVAELQTARESGEDQAAAIWTSFSSMLGGTA